MASPYLAAGSRVVLGRISVYAGYSQAPVPVTDDGPWRYWQKRAILIRAGTGPVTVSVPSSWRKRAAITYGTYGIVSSLMLTACQQPAGVWDEQGMFFDVISPDRKLPIVATRDIAAVAARLLLDNTWAGQAEVPVLGPEDLSSNDMAAIMSEVLGTAVRYQQLPGQAFRDQLTGHGVSDAMAQGMLVGSARSALLMGTDE